MNTNVITLDEKDFPELIRQLEGFKPVTCMVIGHLRCALDGNDSVKCFVDSWPQGMTTAIVTSLDNYPYQTASIHSTNQDRLRSLLNSDTVDWGRFQFFGGLNTTTVEVVEEVATARSLKFQNFDKHYLFWADNKEPDKNDLGDLPPGYRFSKLDASHVDTVARQWALTTDGTFDYFRLLFANYVTVSVESTESGELVGWYVEHRNGLQGMLYVHEAHRGRGLGKHLVRRLKALLSAQNKDLFVYTAIDNPVSIRLQEGAGYRRAPDYHFAVYVWPSTREPSN